MSIEKFKPIIWAKSIEEGLKRDSVFYEDCNHEYEGIATQPGDTIKILGIGEPSLRRWSDGKLHQLSTPETIQDLSMVIPMNQIADFNFFIDDLDKRQAVSGGSLLDKYTARAKYKIQNEEDKYIANFALDDAVTPVLHTSGSPTTALNADKKFLELIDKAYATLMERDVPNTAEVVLTIDYHYLNVLRTQYENLDTNNHDMVGNGKVGRYHNIIIKVSNNCAEATVSGNDYKFFQMKTRNAISFVRPYIHLEAYKPEQYFADAVKGYSLFDGAVTAPKEIVALQAPKLT